VGRRDRRVNRDGQPTHTNHVGVAFLVREGVHYEDKPDVATSAVAPNDDTTECSAIKIYDPRLVEPVTILNVYVSPIRAVDVRDHCFDPNFLLSTPDTFVLGDFNAHSSTWDPNCPEDLSDDELDDWAILGDRVVLNDSSPTRVSSRGVATAPDVTFVPSAWEQHFTWNTGSHIGSDHLPIIIEVSGGNHLQQPRRKVIFSYKKADWSTLEKPWTQLSLSGITTLQQMSIERTLCSPLLLLSQRRRPPPKDFAKPSAPGGVVKWSKPLYGAVRPKKIFMHIQTTTTRPRPFSWPPARLRKPSKKPKLASGKSSSPIAEAS